MPEMDGFEVCRQLKQDEQLKEIPVIFITAMVDSEEKLKGFFEGAVDYITKPFQVEEVMARIRLHLKLCKLQQELVEHNRTLETRIGERTQQLREALSRLAVLDQAKTDFLRTISHELRTPLNGLFGVADLMFISLPDSEENKSYMQIFDEAKQRILNLVDDALLLNELRCSDRRYAASIHLLDDIIRVVVEGTRSACQKRDITMICAVNSSITIAGNKELLVRALDALILTALKFTRLGGSIDIHYGQNATGVVLFIEAVGHSIPEDVLPKFFETLAVGNTVVSGADLGLSPAVAAYVIRECGGSVTVENTKIPGIRFIITFRDKPLLQNSDINAAS